MKKFLSLVLALALVLGMATVAFAAEYPKNKDVMVDLPADATVVGIFWTELDKETVEVPLTASDITIANDRVEFDAAYATEGAKIVIEYTKPDDTKVYSEVATIKVTVDDPVPTQYVKDQLQAAYAANATVAYFDLNCMSGKLTAEDVAYINNTWKAGWVDQNNNELGYKYLALDLYFYWGNGDADYNGYVGQSGTTYYISAADYDYTWTTGIDFNETDNLGKYDQTAAEIANAIRKMTGDVKQPYIFGFAQPTATGYSTTVPYMTISKVIPQQWINVYGHKNLSLSVYTHAEGKCPECSAATAEHLHALTADIVVDAATQTQRIEFATTTMYKTLVLAKNAVAAPEAADKTDDANPNTGVNDMVNVAIVFAVVSLIAAGSFVFSKASR